MNEEQLNRWEKLDAYLRDELSAQERSQLEAQLAADEQLREELEITRAEHDLAQLAWEDSFRGKVRNWINVVENGREPLPPPDAARPWRRWLWILGGITAIIAVFYFSNWSDHPDTVIIPPGGGESTSALDTTKLHSNSELVLQVPSSSEKITANPPFCDSTAAREKFKIYYAPQLVAGANNQSQIVADYFALRDSFNRKAFRSITKWQLPADTNSLYALNSKDLQGRAFFHEWQYGAARQCFQELFNFYTAHQMPNEQIGAARKYLLTLQASCDAEALQAFCRNILQAPSLRPLYGEAEAILKRQ